MGWLTAPCCSPDCCQEFLCPRARALSFLLTAPHAAQQLFASGVTAGCWAREREGAGQGAAGQGSHGWHTVGGLRQGPRGSQTLTSSLRSVEGISRSSGSGSSRSTLLSTAPRGSLRLKRPLLPTRK